MTTAGLNTAGQAKQDEFYTSLRDIEIELEHYKSHFGGKVVYCNCDDPRDSNFFRYFAENFKKPGLEKVIATCCCNQDIYRCDPRASGQAVYLEYTGENDDNGAFVPDRFSVKPMIGDGDFRSAECIEFLHQADIVVTNPPFSLFREFVAQLIANEKKFLIIGNMNAVTYKEIFPLFRNNEIWYGPSIRSGDREFQVPDNYPLDAAGTRIGDEGKKYVRVKGVRWFTNLECRSRHVELDLKMNYRPDLYPKYANFDAIEVGRTMHIPADYDGLMGVPISFLDKFNPDRFEILGSSKTLSRPMSEVANKGTYRQGGPRFYLSNGDGTYRRMYDRIVIRARQHPASGMERETE